MATPPQGPKNDAGEALPGPSSRLLRLAKVTQKRAFPGGFPAVLPVVSRRFSSGFADSFPAVRRRFSSGFAGGLPAVFRRFSGGFPAVLPVVSRRFAATGFLAVFSLPVWIHLGILWVLDVRRRYRAGDYDRWLGRARPPG